MKARRSPETSVTTYSNPSVHKLSVYEFWVIKVHKFTSQFCLIPSISSRKHIAVFGASFLLSSVPESSRMRRLSSWWLPPPLIPNIFCFWNMWLNFICVTLRFIIRTVLNTDAYYILQLCNDRECHANTVNNKERYFFPTRYRSVSHYSAPYTLGRIF